MEPHNDKFLNCTDSINLTRLAAAITLIISPFHLEAKTAPEIMTARHYEKQIPSEAISTQDTTSAYYVSEKLDGIRASGMVKN